MTYFFTGIILVLLPLGTSSKLDITWIPSPNYNERIDHATGAKVDKPNILVMHYTVGNLSETFKIFQSKAGQVSSHYTVAENGSIYQHVEEKFRARHAGIGNWRESNDVNTYSIGIEIVNAGFKSDPSQPPGKIVPGSPLEWYSFKPKQIEAVITLSSDIFKRFNIEPRNVIGHTDLAPGRKVDPGPLFPWSQLARKGIGAWVNKTELNPASAGNTSDVSEIQKKLREYGFTAVPASGKMDTATKNGLVAFQMHFRQSKIDGTIDKETVGVLDALLKKYVQS